MQEVLSLDKRIEGRGDKFRTGAVVRKSLLSHEAETESLLTCSCVSSMLPQRFLHNKEMVLYALFYKTIEAFEIVAEPFLEIGSCCVAQVWS